MVRYIALLFILLAIGSYTLRNGKPWPTSPVTIPYSQSINDLNND